jgi:hypothetical protein
MVVTSASLPAVDRMPSANARKIEQECLHRLALIGLAPAAEAMEVDVSTVQRLKTPEHRINFSSLSRLLDALGLTVVELGATVITPDQHRALVTMAEIGLKSLKE